MFIRALLVAIIATISTGWINHIIAWPAIYPVFSGFLVGLAMGEPTVGMIAGATINLAYLGWITAGGSMPGNLSVAGVFGTALTILSGADPKLAVSFAIPLSLIGILMWNLQMTINVFWVHKADAYAEEGNTKGVQLMTYLFPQLTVFLINGVPAFLLVYFGGDFFMNLISNLPESFINALEVVGGLMPALGIGMLLKFIGKKKLIPFFFIGFFISSYLGLNLMAIAILGAAIAAYSYMSSVKKESLFDDEGDESEEKSEHDTGSGKKLRKKDLVLHWFLGLSQECAYNYERLQATGTCAAIIPIIKRLYNTKEDISAALKRYLVFFNTEPCFVGPIIPGICASMEEQRANGIDITDESVISLRTGLMGPLAGVGDTLSQGILYPTVAALACSMAIEGNALGPVLFFAVFSGLMVLLGYNMYMLGYTKGKESIIKLLQSNMLEQVTDAFSILGLMVIGAMGAERVLVNIPISFTVGQTTVIIQEVIDSLIPNLVPLLIILIIWNLVKKNKSITYIMLGLMAVGIIATYIGIFGLAV